ncbi:MAG: STAS domain-containing protein [Anaerolineae bacterium]
MLEIHQSTVGKVIILDIKGRIDAINSHILQSAIDRASGDAHERPLLLGMADVNYLSASGLRVLRILKEQSGTVRIFEPSNRVIDVMHITGLDAVYELYLTRTEALQQATDDDTL